MDGQRDWHLDFDHADPDYVAHMWEVHRDLRAHCPVAAGCAHGGFKVLTRAEDIRGAMRSPELFLSGNGVTLPDLRAPFPSIPVETDGEAHRAYRQLLQRWFSPAAVEQLEASLYGLVDEHLDALEGRDRVDFVAEFSWPLPAAVIAVVMGLPRSEWRVIKQLFGGILAANVAGDGDAIAHGWAGLIDYLADQVEARRAEPRDDMLTELAHAEVQGRPLSYEETMGIAYTLVTAGQDTTSNAIGMLAQRMAEQPALRQRLMAEPTLIPEAIEESLRWFGPIQTTSRTLARDTELHGCPLKAGERVALLLGSANRDEALFERADDYDIDRANKRKHVAFGAGVHTCSGIHLARLELRIVFERLLARLPGFVLAGEPRAYFPGGMVFGLASLPLRFEAAGEVSRGNRCAKGED